MKHKFDAHIFWPLTNPTLHSSTWTGLHNIWRIHSNVQAQHQRDADRLHLQQQENVVNYPGIKATIN